MKIPASMRKPMSFGRSVGGTIKKGPGVLNTKPKGKPTAPSQGGVAPAKFPAIGKRR